VAVVQYTFTQIIHRTTQLIWEEYGPCPVFTSYTLAFALQLRGEHGKTSVSRKNLVLLFILFSHGIKKGSVF
jgi:hypothetical protein